MNTNERRAIRRPLADLGFQREDMSTDPGNGAYMESFRGPDGTLVLINWAPKTPDEPEAKQPREQRLPEHIETTYWECGKGHVFPFGDEPWHREPYANQGWEPELGLIPVHCSEEMPNGEPCLDSTSLVGLGTEA